MSSISGSDTADSLSSSEGEEDGGGGSGDAGGGAEASAARPSSRTRRARDGGGTGKVPQFVFETAGEVIGRAGYFLLFLPAPRCYPSDAPPDPHPRTPSRSPRAPLPAGARLAVWRCLLYPDHHARARPSEESLLSELRRVRSSAASWVLLLARGGHFAGAVFRMRLAPPGKGQHAGEAFEVVAHKTFHRYVVRWGVRVVLWCWQCYAT